GRRSRGDVDPRRHRTAAFRVTHPTPVTHLGSVPRRLGDAARSVTRRRLVTRRRADRDILGLMSDTPLTIADAATALRDGSLTSVELTKRSTAVADELDPRLGTYIARYDEAALEAAQRADTELASGRDRGPLHGIPVGIKDIL